MFLYFQIFFLKIDVLFIGTCQQIICIFEFSHQLIHGLRECFEIFLLKSRIGVFVAARKIKSASFKQQKYAAAARSLSGSFQDLYEVRVPLGKAQKTQRILTHRFDYFPRNEKVFQMRIKIRSQKRSGKYHQQENISHSAGKTIECRRCRKGEQKQRRIQKSGLL